MGNKGRDTRPSESALIAQYFAPLSHGEAAFGLSDDAAFLAQPEGYDLVISKDMLVADIHFFANDPPKTIAQKALRVNLSDLAAKGAKPWGYCLGLGLPDTWQEAWLAEFCEGLLEDQTRFACPLLGGDTVRSPERLTLSVTIFGLVPKGQHLLRQKTRPGDQLYVTGTLGDAALGLKQSVGELPVALSQQSKDYLRQRYLLPEPRLALGPSMLACARGCMDISDGLLGDAEKMASASQTRLAIDGDQIPLSDAAKEVLRLAPDLWPVSVSGGDDYELLMAIPEDKEAAFLTGFEQSPQRERIQLTKIGHVVEGRGLKLKGEKSQSLTSQSNLSYQHF